jgi:hypothetical protein
MKLNAILAVAIALALGGIAAGCGGGDDSTSGGQADTTAQAITKEDFIAQADQICDEGNKQTEQQLEQQFGNKVTDAQLPQIASAVSDSIKNQVSQIRALGAPEGDEDTVNSFLDAAEKGADEIAQDPSQVQSQGEPNADIAKANQEAKQYGLNVCGQS